MTVDRQLPVFYINLASRPDRRAFMEEQFARLGVTAERIEAVTIAEVPEDIARDGIASTRVWPLSKGHLACGLSHQRIWRLMLERNLPAAVILEDDALIAPAFVDALAPDVLKRLGCDLVKLETRRRTILLGEPTGTLGTGSLHELQSSHMGSAAYVISQKIARSSLADASINNICVDRYLFGKTGPHLLRSSILQVVPSPVVQLDRLTLDDDVSRRSSAARSDLAIPRRARARIRPTLPAIYRLAESNIDHVVRLVQLAFRDRGALSRARRAVAYSGDADATTSGVAG